MSKILRGGVHKYSISQILRVVTASALVLFAVSCKTEVEHEHTFSTEWTNDETYHWHAATCEHTEEVSEKAEHTFDEGKVTLEATETKDGEKTFTCTVCGYKKFEKIDAKGHSFDKTTWKSDKTNHWHECACGEKTDVAAHEEDEGTVTTAATCIAKGVKTYKCKTCGYVMRTEETPVDSNNHSFDKTTWKKDGTNHWHECSCGEKTDEAAHEEDEGTVTTAATCTTKGVKTYKCKTCGYLRTEEIPPLGFVKVTGTEVGSFYMAETELTYARWYEVYQWAVKNGYTFQDLGREGNNGTNGAKPTENSNQPVTYVSWRDAIIWCNAASEMENLTPYYYVEGTTDFTDKSKVVRLAEDYDSKGTNKANTNTAKGGEGTADKAVCNTASNGYRLPTEKEWEYAAKGGKDFTYSGSDTIDDVAWYSENSESKTHDVGTKKPNKYGLKDMSGNVWEWCWDLFTSGSSSRVYRGGSCYVNAGSCAVSHRDYDSPYGRSSSLGFRVCRSSAN